MNGPLNRDSMFLENIKILEEATDAFTITSVSLSEKTKGKSRPTYEKADAISRKANDDWNWLKKCEWCCSEHLKLSHEYHMFWCRVAECDAWMTDKLRGILKTFQIDDLRGDRADGLAFIEDIKMTLLEWTRWQFSLTTLHNSSKTIYPIHLRNIPLEKQLVVKLLCDISDGNTELTEDSQLTLTNNEHSSWKVHNTESGQDSDISSLFLVILPPCEDAISSATRCNLQLLSLWLTSYSLLGKKLIAYLLLVFKDWSESEREMLRATNPESKAELLALCDLIVDQLSPIWQNDTNYKELEERLSRLRAILNEERLVNGVCKDENPTVIVLQGDVLRKLIAKYKDFGDFCKDYSQIVDDMRASVHVVLPENYYELRFVTVAYHERMYEADLITAEARNAAENLGGFLLHETPSEPLMRSTTSAVNLTRSEETTETDQIVTTVQEDQTTFAIDSVVDPRNQRLLTLEEAIRERVFDEERNLYRNPDNGVCMSIGEALNSGKINVTFKGAKTIREEKSSVGLITIRTTKETRPYEITGVLHPRTNELLTLQEAIDESFYDEATGEYKSENGEKLSIVNAIDSGCIQVAYRGQGEETPETACKTFAVSSVVDQRKKRRISFSDAVRMRIVDRETGDYFHNVNRERIPVSDAIKRGFIKARVVEEEDDQLNIDPENKIVVDRVKRVKDKLLKSIKVSQAFKA